MVVKIIGSGVDCLASLLDELGLGTREGGWHDVRRKGIQNKERPLPVKNIFANAAS
jgi:hypothetical protein